ncbi:MAG: pilus assembly protein [Planctomycetaceae bacterium]|nr:pilus assembly protein [Planctomycetaceae bacterium]
MKRHCFTQAEHAQSQRRRGTAATEFAVCLPILIVLLIGTIEACSMIYLKQSLSVASYEGIRASVASGATTASVTTACNRILTARNVQAATITITPSGFETQPAETLITVRVSAPAASNSIFSGWFYDTIVIDGQATMMKEF